MCTDNKYFLNHLDCSPEIASGNQSNFKILFSPEIPIIQQVKESTVVGKVNMYISSFSNIIRHRYLPCIKQ